LAKNIDSSYRLLKHFSEYVNGHEEKHYWVYSGYKELGSLLLKDLGNDKRIMIKPSDSELSIGRAKIKKFIDQNVTFKGQHVDRYLLIGRLFRDNSKRYAKSESNITLIEVDFEAKTVSIFGSMNIDRNLIFVLIEFFESIEFELKFDYEGMLRHEGFVGGEQKVKKEEEQITNPTVFVSYSWDSEEHKLWVLKLSADLIRSGVRVLIDEWDLIKYQNDLHLFMESGIRDSDFVLIICTPNYAQRANDRKGGVGVENTIITGEYHDLKAGVKYLPIVRDYKAKITESMPSYSKTKSAIDFKQNDKYDQKIEELLRRIFNKPRYLKPKLGKVPDLKTDSI